MSSPAGEEPGSCMEVPECRLGRRPRESNDAGRSAAISVLGERRQRDLSQRKCHDCITGHRTVCTTEAMRSSAKLWVVSNPWVKRSCPGPFAAVLIWGPA